MKKPYGKYTLKEIKGAEATMYYIQVGASCFDLEGTLLFEKDEAEELFDTLGEGMRHIMETGTFEEKEDTRELLLNFRILPLRIV